MVEEKITFKRLLEEADKAKSKAYAPYSRFSVGAALLTRSGKIFSGCNVENASYGLTICAERVAVVKAISEGERYFHAIAVIADAGVYCRPCGACLQFLAEFGTDIQVVMGNPKGEYEVKTVAELLPMNFRLGSGKESER
ncbi:cytidine deaminase [Calderihabitans maritimus]|uniref:Cytidine deaminase n=1 Tax=Calderihabitans maritimus TaxID=1246530 RepID=A0A1Z5HV98_9FIRM|nr:cytidine deaminase [Calderihabitans maritimus]GAW93434.1 cytidine deaminase [Calderihabitans maritimus]